MKHVNESLSQFNDTKFFSKLNEEDASEQEKKEMSPEEKTKIKAQLEKQGMSVIKKLQSNFKNFKASAGDKMQEYRDFWTTQLSAKETIQQEGMFYNLFDSDYIVGVAKHPKGNAELKVYNTSSKDENEYETFVSKDEIVIKAFVQFFKGEVESTMRNVITTHKAAMKAKKIADKTAAKEASISAKKAKLDGFLQESQK